MGVTCRVLNWRLCGLAGLMMLAVVLFSHAQTVIQRTPQRLLSQIATSGRDTARIDLLLELSAYYFDTEWNYRNKAKVDSAWQYLAAAQHLADSLRSFEHQQRTLVYMGNYFFRCDRVARAEACFAEVARHYRAAGKKREEAETWLMFGSRSPLVGALDTIVTRYDRAKRIYEALGDEVNTAGARREIAFVRYWQGQLGPAERELAEVLEIQMRNHVEDVYYTYDLQAHVSALQGNHHIAIRQELAAIQSLEQSGHRQGASFYSSLGRFYGEIGETEKSIHWLSRSLNIVKQLSSPRSPGYITGSVPSEGRNLLYDLTRRIAQGMIRQGRSRAALEFLQDIIHDYPPDTDMARELKAGALGDCYAALKQYKKAEGYYQEAIGLEIFSEQIAELRKEYINISQLFVRSAQYGKAAPYLNKLLAEPEGTLGVPLLIDLYKILYKVDSASGNYLAALQHFQRYKTLNDSIFNERKLKQIEEIQAQYEMSQKEQHIQLLRNEAELQRTEIQRAILAKNLTFGGLALVLILFTVLYWSYRNKQRSNRQLQEQQREIASQNYSLQNLVDEKEWLLKEVHHRVKNNLATIASLLNSQSAYLQSEEALLAIRDSQHRVQAMSIIHQKLYVSESVSTIDMALYIHELADYLSDSFNLGHRIRFDIHAEALILHVTQAVPLGLILNEAITNAIKHAFPHDASGIITIRLEHAANDLFSLTIADNGIGMAPGVERHNDRSLGMSLMKGLSEDIGASFDIHRRAGTTIEVKFRYE
jgi:two-component system, sensor histidine kinase PdtaS